MWTARVPSAKCKSSCTQQMRGLLEKKIWPSPHGCCRKRKIISPPQLSPTLDDSVSTFSGESNGRLITASKSTILEHYWPIPTTSRVRWILIMLLVKSVNQSPTICCDANKLWLWQFAAFTAMPAFGETEAIERNLRRKLFGSAKLNG